MSDGCSDLEVLRQADKDLLEGLELSSRIIQQLSQPTTANAESIKHLTDQFLDHMERSQQVYIEVCSRHKTIIPFRGSNAENVVHEFAKDSLS